MKWRGEHDGEHCRHSETLPSGGTYTECCRCIGAPCKRAKAASQ